MADEMTLFGDDDGRVPATQQPEIAHDQVADWQVDLLRKSMDARGIAGMSDRQAFVERFAGRSLQSLRDLTAVEAVRILGEIGNLPRSAPEASLWDSRDEDTWIDRL